MKQAGAPILEKPKFSEIEGARAYASLKKQVVDAGILDREYLYYFLLSIVSLAGLFGSLYFLIISASFIAIIFSSLVFTIFSIQLAGLFHDSGHRAVFKSTVANDIFGNFIAALSNISFTYWKFKHNKHHANTNEIDADPDLDIPLISFTNKRSHKSALGINLIRYQAYLYYPMGIFVLFYEKTKSIQFLFKNFNARAILQLVLITFGMFVWYILPFLVFDFTKAVEVVFFVNLFLGIYLMNIFAPNHKGMPQIEKGAKFSFFEQQIITSRNIRSNWFLDITFIGLNYQIEHHLFPNCPRNKLKLITPYVVNICKKYHLEYSEVSLVETNKIILAELQQIALE